MSLNADYLINVANLKPHAHAGISLTAKNHSITCKCDNQSLHYRDGCAGGVQPMAVS